MTERQLMFRIKLITSVAVALLVLLAAFICFQLISLRNLRDTEARLERELEVLKRQTQTLEEEIEYRNSRTFIEQYAREKLGLGYSNESRYVFEEEEKNSFRQSVHFIGIARVYCPPRALLIKWFDRLFHIP